jgi:hypothetical protein
VGHSAEQPFKARNRQVLPAQPLIQAHVQHVLFEGCGISTDPDQYPFLGGLADDRVQCSGAALVSMMERRRRGPVQRGKHFLGAQPARGPRLKRRQSTLRVSRTAIQWAQQRRLEMIGAGYPGACPHRNAARYGFHDGGGIIGVEKRVIVRHRVREAAQQCDRFRSRGALIENDPDNQGA